MFSRCRNVIMKGLYREIARSSATAAEGGGATCRIIARCARALLERTSLQCLTEAVPNAGREIVGSGDGMALEHALEHVPNVDQESGAVERVVILFGSLPSRPGSPAEPGPGS